MMNNEYKKGFTLVEVLIAMFVTSILLAAVYFLFVRVFTMNSQQTQFIEAQDTLRTVSYIVEKDVRKSTQHLKVNKIGNDTHLIFLDRHGNELKDDKGNLVEIIYTLENDQLKRNGKNILDRVDDFTLEMNHDFEDDDNNPVDEYVYIKLLSKTSKREVTHDKKIYLRKTYE